MQSTDPIKEISILEIEIENLKKVLDKSIDNNEEFNKTKSIFHELKKLTDKLEKIRNTDLVN